MASLAELRDEFPDLYQDMSDADMVYTLAQGMGRSPVRVAHDMGLDPSGYVQNQSTGEDFGTSFELGGRQTVRGLVNLPNVVSGLITGENLYETPGMDNEIRRLEGTFSPGYQETQKEIGNAWDEGRYGDYALGLATNPSYTGNQIAQSAPSMVGGGLFGAGVRGVTALGALGRGAVAAGVGRAAPYLGEGAVMTGTSYKNMLEADVAPREAALYSLGIGAGGAAVAGASGALANRAGVVDPERLFTGMGRKVGDDVVPMSYPAQIGVGMGLEAGEEALQSPWEQSLSNVAQGEPWDQGLARSAIEGGLVGGIMGGGINALTPPLRRITPDMPTDLLQDDQAPPVGPVQGLDTGRLTMPSDVPSIRNQVGLNNAESLSNWAGVHTPERADGYAKDLGSAYNAPSGHFVADKVTGVERELSTGDWMHFQATGQLPAATDPTKVEAKPTPKPNVALAAEQAKQVVERQYLKDGWTKTPEKITLLEAGGAPKLTSGVYGKDARKFVDDVLVMDPTQANTTLEALQSKSSPTSIWKGAVVTAHLKNLAQRESDTLAQQAQQNATIDGPGVTVPTSQVGSNAQPTEGVIAPTVTTSSVVQDAQAAAPPAPPIVQAAPDIVAPPAPPVAPPAAVATPQLNPELATRATSGQALLPWELDDTIRALAPEVLRNELASRAEKWISPVPALKGAAKQDPTKVAEHAAAVAQRESRLDQLRSTIVEAMSKRRGLGAYDGNPVSLDEIVNDFILRDETGLPVIGPDGKVRSLADVRRGTKYGTWTHQTIKDIDAAVQQALEARGVNFATKQDTSPQAAYGQDTTEVMMSNGVLSNNQSKGVKDSEDITDSAAQPADPWAGEFEADGKDTKFSGVGGANTAKGTKVSGRMLQEWAKLAGYDVVGNPPAARDQALADVRALPKLAKELWNGSTEELINSTPKTAERDRAKLAELFQALRNFKPEELQVGRISTPAARTEGAHTQLLGGKLNVSLYNAARQLLDGAPAFTELTPLEADLFRRAAGMTAPDGDRSSLLRGVVSDIIERRQNGLHDTGPATAAAPAQDAPGPNAGAVPADAENGAEPGSPAAGVDNPVPGLGDAVAENRDISGVAVRTKKRRVAQNAEPDSTTRQGQAAAAENPTTEGVLRAEIKRLLGTDRHWRLHLYANVDEAIAAGHAPRKIGDAYGWVDTNDKGVKEAFFIVDRIEAGTELASFLHEVGAHIGMSNLIPPKLYQNLVNQLRKWAAQEGNAQETVLAKAALERIAAAQAARTKAGHGTMAQVEQDDELVAYFLEEAVKAGLDPTAIKAQTALGRWFRTLWATFKIALRKLRMQNIESLTGQNVVDLAYGAARLDINTKWHGTVNTFRRFDSKFMSAGAGGQWYSWGHYVGNRKGTGNYYMEMLVDKNAKPEEVMFDGKPGISGAPAEYREIAAAVVKHSKNNPGKPVGHSVISVGRRLRAEIRYHESGNFEDGVSRETVDDWKAQVKWLETNAAKFTLSGGTPEGQLFLVDVDAQADEIMHWDLPFNEQPERIQNILKAASGANETVQDRLLAGDESVYDATEDFLEREAPKVTPPVVGRPEAAGVSDDRANRLLRVAMEWLNQVRAGTTDVDTDLRTYGKVYWSLHRKEDLAALDKLDDSLRKYLAATAPMALPVPSSDRDGVAYNGQEVTYEDIRRLGETPRAFALRMVLDTIYRRPNEGLPMASAVTGAIAKIDAQLKIFPRSNELKDSKAWLEENAARLSRPLEQHAPIEITDDTTGKQIAQRLVAALQGDPDRAPMITGSEYSSDEGKAASLYLDSLGIKGMEHFDESSRTLLSAWQNAQGMLQNNGSVTLDPAKVTLMDKRGRTVAVGPNDKEALMARMMVVRRGTVKQALDQWLAAAPPNPGTSTVFRDSVAVVLQSWLDAGVKVTVGDKPKKLTTNLVVYNDKNIHRVARAPEGNTAPENIRYGIAGPKASAVKSHIEAGKEGVLNVMSDTYTGSNRALLGWMGINQMVERYGDTLPVLKSIDKTFRAMSHQAKTWLDRGEQIDRLWSMLTPKQLELANDIAGNASLLRFDPSKDKADTPEKQAVAQKWQALKALDAANPKAKGTTVVLAAVQHFRDVMTESLKYLDTVKQAAIAAGASTHAIESLENTIKALKKRQTYFYLPLHRFGDFYSVAMSPALFNLAQRRKQHLADVANHVANPAVWDTPDEKLYRQMRKDPTHYENRGFESERAARRHAEKLKAKGWHATSNVQKFTSDLARAHLKPELAAFDRMLADTKVDAKVAAKLRDSYTDLLIEALPDGHELKHQLDREGIAGWDADMRRAFAKTAQSQAFAASRLLHARQLSEQIDQLGRAGDSFEPHAELARGLFNELKLQQELASTRSEDPFLVRFATGFNYMSLLGASPFFWALQLAQVPTITFPYLVGRNKSNVADTFRKLTSAWKQATQYITWKVEANEWRAELDFSRAIPNVSQDELQALKDMDDAGRFVFTIGQDLGAAAEGRNTKTARLIRSLNTPTHATELINRVSTGLAAYRISQKNKAGLTQRQGETASDFAKRVHDAAVEFSLHAVDNTQVNMDPVMGARNLKTVFGSGGTLSRSAARIIFQFWKFQQGMAYTTLTTMKDAWMHPDPELRQQARSTAVGLTLSLMLTSGAFGLPFVGTGMMLLSLVFGLDGDDDEDDNAERATKNWLAEHLPKPVADAMNRGIIWGLLPTDAAPFASPRFSMGTLMNPLGYARFDDAERGEDVIKELMFRTLGGPTGSSAAALWDGVQAAMDGNFAKATEKAAPLKLARDLARTYQLATTGVSTGAGETRIDPESLSAMSWVWQAMGATPMKKGLYHEGQAAVQGLKQAVSGEREKLLAKHAQTRLKGEDVSHITQDIMRFNQRHPEVRIKAENLRQAHNRRRDNQRKLTDTGVLADKQNRPYLGNAVWAQ